MKRYLLFAGESYYPSGGMFDCLGSFDTLKEAVTAAEAKIRTREIEWWHVLDTTTGRYGNPHKSKDWSEPVP